MNKLFAFFCCLGVTFLVLLVGCSSKEEVANVPAQAPAPAAASQDNYDSTSDDTSMSDGSDDGSVADDGSTDDGSGETDVDDGSMVDTSGDDGSMATDDGSMNDDGSGVAAVRAKPKNLREQAEQAFGDGYEKAAYRLIQAHILASSTDASELLAHYRWSPSRRQPQLGVRIAIGVELTAPPEVKNSFKPIGSLKGFFTGRKSSSRSRAVDTGDDEQPDAGASATLLATNDKERILQKYTGLMGDVLVDHVRSTHGEGKWAPVFQSLTGVVSTASPLASGDGTDDSADDGSESDDGSGGMAGLNLGKVELATKIEGEEAKYISVGPILTYIGNGTSAELLEQAKSGEFDALIVFDVEVTINMKLRMIYNQCRAKFLNFADGKSLASSKLLKNTESQKEIDKSGREFVVAAMQPILTKLDEMTAMKDVPPTLTPEIIKSKRMETLLSGSLSKLDALTEIRLYREKSLLEDEEVSAAFEAILGAEDGKALANGTDEERLAIVKKLLTES